jgi:hypothetical protein
MAYPENSPFNQVTVSSVGANLTSGNNVAVRVPFRSKLMKTAVCLGSAAATANASVAVSYVNAGSTVAVSVLGSSVVTVTQSNSYAGQVFESTPTAEIILEEGSGIMFAVTGSSTSGGAVQYSAVLREA